MHHQNSCIPLQNIRPIEIDSLPQNNDQMHHLIRFLSSNQFQNEGQDIDQNQTNNYDGHQMYDQNINSNRQNFDDEFGNEPDFEGENGNEDEDEGQNQYEDQLENVDDGDYSDGDGDNGNNTNKKRHSKARNISFNRDKKSNVVISGYPRVNDRHDYEEQDQDQDRGQEQPENDEAEESENNVSRAQSLSNTRNIKNKNIRNFGSDAHTNPNNFNQNEVKMKVKHSLPDSKPFTPNELKQLAGIICFSGGPGKLTMTNSGTREVFAQRLQDSLREQLPNTQFKIRLRKKGEKACLILLPNGVERPSKTKEDLLAPVMEINKFLIKLRRPDLIRSLDVRTS